jgi:Protein of unknown function (DUF3307)
VTLFAALLVGHLIGDWIVQTDRQAATKTAPGLVGHLAMCRHLLGYHATLLLVLAATGWVTREHRAAGLATLTISYVTHGIIDRRWTVRWLMAATGSAEFAAQPWGVLVVDQVLHVSVLAACTALWGVL